MEVAFGIAIVWLLAGLACYCVLWFQNRRPLNDTDRLCSQIDHALRSQYGARPSWFR
jgi:hypothetical protein